MNGLEQNKALLVAAHRQGNWEMAAQLSQQRQQLKKPKLHRCAGTSTRPCTEIISRHATRCRVCARQMQTAGAAKLLPSPVEALCVKISERGYRSVARELGIRHQTLMERVRPHLRFEHQPPQARARNLATDDIAGMVKRFGGNGAAEIMGVSRKTVSTRLKSTTQ